MNSTQLSDSAYPLNPSNRRAPGRAMGLVLSILTGPALLAVLFLSLARPARAAGYMVTNTNNSGPGSLRQAILDANGSAGPDLITFDLSGCPCTIPLTSSLEVTDILTITGPGTSLLALDGGSAVQILQTANVPVAISGLTLRNGSGATGGGIFASGTLTISQMVLEGNTAGSGGGIYGTGKIRVVDSVFENNTANLQDGGGIYGTSKLKVTGSLFYNNRATVSDGSGGGAGLAGYGPTIITQTQFISNTSADWGGGAFLSNISDTEQSLLIDVQFLGNIAAGEGGGLFSSFTTTLNAVNFIDNYSGERGGGVFAGFEGNYPVHVVGGRMEINSGLGGGGLYSDSDISLLRTLVLSNTARSGNGGGVWSSMAATITSAYIVNNSASGIGGGIYTGESLTLTHTTLYNNHALGGAGGGSRTGGNISVIDSQYISNTATGDGGGLLVYGTVRVTGSSLRGNSSGSLGGAISLPGEVVARLGGTLAPSLPDLFISRTEFSSNRAASGGAVYLGGSSGTIVNTLFARNAASEAEGEALALSPNGMLSIQYTTIATPTLAGGSAIFVGGGVVEILNSIVASHTVGILQLAGAVNADSTLFRGNLTDTVGSVTITNPLSGEPAFFDPAVDDYHLGAGSEAVNVGADINVVDDIDGDTRPQGGGFDVGYDEAAAPIGLTANSDAPTNLGNPTTFTATVTSGMALSYLWDFGDGSSGTGSVAVHTYAAMDTYTVTVTAENGGGSLSAVTTARVVKPFTLPVYLPLASRAP